MLLFKWKKKENDWKRGRKLEVKIKQREKERQWETKKKKKVKEKREFCVRLIFHLRALQCFFFFVFLLKPQLQILFVRRNWKKFISNKVKIVLNPFRFLLTKLNYFFILSKPNSEANKRWNAKLGKQFVSEIDNFKCFSKPCEVKVVKQKISAYSC